MNIIEKLNNLIKASQASVLRNLREASKRKMPKVPIVENINGELKVTGYKK